MGEKGPSQGLASKVSYLLNSYGSPTEARSPLFFNDFSVIGSGNSTDVAPTIFSKALSLAQLLNPRTYYQEPVQRTLLHSFNGVIKPGEMVLVIGKPGSGCTTFLKSIAGLRDEFHDITGTLKYGNETLSETNQNSLRRTFCAEEDDHLPTLNVEETIKFAVQSSRPTNASTISSKEVTASIADLFGLSHVLRTRVGSAAVRGVSGGERRRVSLAEALATDADLLCLDNPTNGLDSSTALEFVQMMREYTTQSRCATVMSVYQGSDAMMSSFDKILVISRGRQVYYGRAAEAKPYFEEMGHRSPDRTTVTDFLTSMTADRVAVSIPQGGSVLPPRTASQLEKAYKSSQHYKKAVQDVEDASRVVSPDVTRRKPFEQPLWKQVLLCSRRQFRVLATNYHNWLIEAVCIIVQSLALGTLFRDQPRETRAFFILACSLFFCTLVPALQAMAEFGNTFASRPLVMRQRRLGFYRPMAYALGLVLTDSLWKIVVIAYNVPQYFLTGFQYDAGKFFTWFLVLYVEHMALSMVMRAVAVSSRTMTRAVLPVGIIFTVAVLYTGLYVPPPSTQIWLGWLRYIDPIYYAWESVMINEFSGQTYLCSPSDLAPSGPGFTSVANQICTVAGSVAGEVAVEGSTYLQEYYGLGLNNLWRNLGINIAFFIFFALFTGIGMELHKPPAGKAATVHYRTVEQSLDNRSPSASDSSDLDVEKAKEHGFGGCANGAFSVPGKTQDVVDVHQGRTLSWKNLSLEINVKGERKRLLQELNGFVRPKQLTALMGMSGAGKTTLLNSLAGRLESGTIQGEMHIDGRPLPSSFRRMMGYVQQQDIHLPTQTVREALQVTARLRQSADVSREEQDAYVERVILMLELQELAEALIGTPGAGLTLEQRKRVSIGVELAARPEVLFLDEPTSGLDGLSAMNIVRLLRRLVDSGQTVLCTIHQPASEVMETFDHLILLVRGGRLAYDGPLGPECSTAIEYFQSQDTTICSQNQNPAEYFLNVVGAGSRSTNTVDWGDKWQGSRHGQNRKKELEDLLLRTSESSETPSKVSSGNTQSYAASPWTQLCVIMKRTWLYNWRDPDYFNAKLAMNVGNGLFNGLTYLNSPNTVAGAYNRALSAFVAILVGPPLGLQAEARFVPLMDIFLLRDRDAMSYHWSVAAISAAVVELPNALLTSLAYWLVWYLPVGYFRGGDEGSDRAGYALLLYLVFSLFAHSLAQLIASVMPSLESAMLANGFFFMFLNTLSGTLSPKPVTPSGWRWYYQLNPLFYYGEGMTTNVLEGLEIQCSADETFTFLPPSRSTCLEYAGEWLQNATGYIVNPNSRSECQYCRYRDGESYYKQYDWDFSNRWRAIGILIGFIMFNYVAAMALLYWTKVYQRNKK